MRKTRFVRVYQPVQKVWSPRTPDTSYDSLGVFPAIGRVVSLPSSPPNPSDPNLPLMTESFGAGMSLEAGTYYAVSQQRSGYDTFGYSLSLLSGTYTP